MLNKRVNVVISHENFIVVGSIKFGVSRFTRELQCMERFIYSNVKTQGILQ